MTGEERKNLFNEIVTHLSKAHQLISKFNAGAELRNKDGWKRLATILNVEIWNDTTLDECSIQLSSGTDGKIDICALKHELTDVDGWEKLSTKIGDVEVVSYERGKK